MADERDTPRNAPGATALRQTQMMLELQHRTRNMLAVVRSIARRTAETSETVEDYVASFDGRLAAYSRTVGLLTQSGLSGIGLDFLIAEELMAVQARDDEQVSISGEPVTLQPSAAETLSLAFHELATNALKHGALAHDAGRIVVSWQVERIDGQDTVALLWAESSPGKLMLAPTRKGFGVTMLEETVPFELSAKTELSFENTGFHCRILLPLTEHVFIRGEAH